MEKTRELIELFLRLSLLSLSSPKTGVELVHASILSL